MALLNLKLVDSLEIYWSKLTLRGKICFVIDTLSNCFIIDWFIFFVLVNSNNILYCNVSLGELRNDTLNYCNVWIIPLIRLPKVLASINLFERVQKFNEKYFFPTKTYLRYIASLFMLFLCAIHWGACLFYLIIVNDTASPLQVSRWKNLEELINGNLFDKYIFALYWIAATASTTGFGDVSINFTETSVIYVFFVIIFFELLVAALLIFVALHVESESSSSLDHFIRVSNTRTMLKVLNILPQTAANVEKHQQLAWHHKRNFADHNTIFADFPLELKNRCAFAIYGSIIESVPFFRNLDKSLLMSITGLCKVQYFLPESEVMYTGYFGPEMRILLSGTVKRTGVDQESYTSEVGSVFGGYSFFFSKKETYTSIATNLVTVLTISRTDFERILLPHPHLFEEIILLFMSEHYN